jgi:DNA-binding GntR family transcriptional regulator
MVQDQTRQKPQSANDSGKKRLTLAEQLRVQLADDIVTGRIAPGVRLDETELAERFGVSRTPVREALRELAASGLVESRPHRGVVVVQITPKRLAEMFEVMSELEAICARIAAKVMTPEERHQLERLHRDCALLVRSGNPQAYSDANLKFHNAIYNGSHNSFLAENTLAVRSRLAPFRRAQFRRLGRLAKSYEEHNAVVEAIVRGDGDGAAAAMRHHIGTVNVAFEDYLSNHSALEPSALAK